MTENVGKEPATRVTFGAVDFGVARFTEEMRGSSHLIPTPRNDICGQLTATGGTVFPTQKLSYERTLPTTSPDYPSEAQFRAVVDGSAIFYWRDCAIYMSFGITRECGVLGYFLAARDVRS